MKDRLLKFVETIREGALFFSYDVLDKKDYVRGRIDCNGGQPVFFASRIGLDIEELTELVEKIIELQKECQKEQDELKSLNTRIAELESARRWVPVSERLPEECTPVLTLSKDNDKPVTAFLDAGFWWSNVDWALNVTHWMPLPEYPNDTQTDTFVYGKENSEVKQ